MEGSLAHPSSPGRANASYISLQNLANRLHKTQKVASAGRVSLISGTTSPPRKRGLAYFLLPNRVFQSRNPEGYFGTSPPAHTFSLETLPNFGVKSRMANHELQIREISYPGKPTGDPRH